MPTKQPRILTQEHKDKMNLARTIAQHKRTAEETANPEIKVKRLADAKAKKAAKSKPDDKPKRSRKQLTPEEQAVSIAKRKATIASKKEVKDLLTLNNTSE